MRLYCMSSGSLRFDQSIFTYGKGMGSDVRVPTLMFLVEHPKGRVLFETGLDPRLATDAAGYWGDVAEEWQPEVTEEDTIVFQLRRLSLEPDDIDFVVLSCLFRDHTGGMKFFPNATFVVQSNELKEAWWPSPGLLASYGQPYEFKDIEPTRGFRFLQLDNEDLDFFGDGSVVILSAPCHAKGEQALLVRLPETGTVLLPAGVIPTRANLEEETLTGRLMVGPEEAYYNVARLKRLAERENALVILHHDFEDWNECRRAPLYYE